MNSCGLELDPEVQGYAVALGTEELLGGRASADGAEQGSPQEKAKPIPCQLHLARLLP